MQGTGSYYQADYYQNPGPHYPNGSARRTFPGWGVAPNMAGPAQIAVGQAAPLAPVSPRMAAALLEMEEQRQREAAGPAIPWWVWVAVPGVGVGLLALAMNMGWIGGEGA